MQKKNLGGFGSRGPNSEPVLLGHKSGPDLPWLGHLRDPKRVVAHLDDVFMYCTALKISGEQRALTILLTN